MRALIVEAGQVRLVEVPTPTLRRDDEVLVRVLVAGICRTDLHVAAGTIATAGPITLGHELCGRVVASSTIAVGTLVTVNPVIDGGFLGITHHGAFADFLIVPAQNVLVLPEIDPRAGAYVEPIAAALAVPEALAGRKVGRVGVFGANRFADLIGEVLRLAGFAVEQITDASRDIDVGVETSGTTAELALLCEVLRPGGLLILRSRNPGAVPVPINLVVEKQLELRGVRYGSFERAVELVATGALELTPLFGDRVPLPDWADAFARARSGEARKLFLDLGDPCVA